MEIKRRVILSIVMAFAVMSPLIISRPEKFLPALIFVAVAFIAIFTITSLFNIHNQKMKIAYLSVMGLIFAYKLYTHYYVMQWVLPKSLVVSLVFTAVFALIFRGISLYIEKDQVPSHIESETK